jgi:hypothetical protein
MRLMLGTKDKPSLLVNVGQEYSPTHFDFWVVNGNWDGTFYNGYVTVHHPWEPYSSLDKVEILCNNQDRLRSSDWSGGYQEVFNNFHNETYMAPKPEPVKLPAGWDDDIPF